MKQILKDNLKLVNFLKKREIIEGDIVEKKRNKIFFNLGNFGIGVCYKNEFYESREDTKQLKVGEKVKVKIVKPDNEDGFIEVSLKKVAEIPLWEYINKLIQNKDEITVKILGVNRGGLLTKIRNIDAFLPTSQLKKENYPDVGGNQKLILQELRKFITKEFKVRIIGIEQATKKLIISEKLEELAVLKQKLSKYKIGDIVEGEVRGIVDYGIFLRFDDIVEGLVHISELDWQLIDDPKSFYKIGQKVKAKIIGISGDQVSLSIKKLLTDPWLSVDIKEGQTLKGKIVRIKSYGVIIDFLPKVHGLIPSSKFADHQEILKKFPIESEGKFKVITFDPKNHRLIVQPV